MKKLTPRAEFVKHACLKRVRQRAWDAMEMASTHDPDHAKELVELRSRVEVLERQMERIGAPRYRTICKGRTNIHVQRVRNLPKPNYSLRVN